MAVLIRYQPSSLTREQYDQVNEALMAQGGSQEMPQPMLLHVLFGEEPNLRVSEIWESEEVWRGFWNDALSAALSNAGIEMPEPEVLAVREFAGSAVSSA